MPSLQAGLVEHLGEEEVHRLATALDKESILFILLGQLLALHLHFQRFLSNRELRRQLLHRHDPAELEVLVCDELCSHHSVEHLVEVDKALIYVDTHLESHPVDVFLLVIVIHAHSFLHLARQFLDEIRQFVRLNLQTLIVF